jgi:hypothetical protein
MDVTMLLCDAAEASGGKLFVLGGGWSVVRRPDVPTPMALAIKISVPWDQANRPHNLKASLLTEDGEPVQLQDEPIQAEGQLEVGRPPGTRPGTPLGAPLALSFGALSLSEGGYVWELEVDDDVVARTPFQVLGG